MKKILVVLLSVVMALALLPSTCFIPVFAATIVASGQCGENLNWSLDTDNVLTISGSGEMDGWLDLERPWEEYKGQITKVIVNQGVTSIGNSAFIRLTALKEKVVLPSSVKKIDDWAFSQCTKLTEVVFPHYLHMYINRFIHIIFICT